MEVFTLNKLIGVLATLAGVVLTSSVDLSGDNEKNRGNFPHKSRKEIAIGDVLAFASAVMYGIYTTVLKKKVGSEARVNMTLFFGFVGLFNTLVLLPGLVIFHFSGVEKFQFPPTQRIWVIVTVSQATPTRERATMKNLQKGPPFIRSIRLFPSSPMFVGPMRCCSQHQSSSRSDLA